MFWVGLTAVAATILVVVGNVASALLLVVVSTIGLVLFLRTTHPRGAGKPNLGIFFDDGDPGPPTSPPAPTRPTRVPAGRPAPRADRAPQPVGDAEAGTGPETEPEPEPEVVGHAADVIDLHQPSRREPAVSGLTVQEAVEASEDARRVSELSDELATHHVRLLRQVQVQLQDYE
jgi:hypothetical protein